MDDLTIILFFLLFLMLGVMLVAFADKCCARCTGWSPLEAIGRLLDRRMP